MVDEKNATQADDDIIDLLDVLEVGSGVPDAAGGAEADFATEFDSLLIDLEAKEAEHKPFPDPTPVDYDVDHNESLDLPSMDDLDSLLAELGASKDEDETPRSGTAEFGDDLDTRPPKGANSAEGNRAGVAAVLDKALADLDEPDTLDDEAEFADEFASELADELTDGLTDELTREAGHGDYTDFSAELADRDADQLAGPAAAAGLTGGDFAPEMTRHMPETPPAGSDAGMTDEKELVLDDDLFLHIDDSGVEVATEEARAEAGAETVVTPEEQGRAAQRPEVSVDIEDLPLDIEGLGIETADATAGQTGNGSPASEPTPVERVAPPSGTARIDEDLNELDALLDNMLATVPVPVAKAASAHDDDEDRISWQDELHDVFERLDNLEASTTTQQLFERCAGLEESLAQKDARIKELETAIAGYPAQLADMETILVQKDGKIEALENSLTGYAEELSALGNNLSQKDADIKTLMTVNTEQSEQLGVLEKRLSEHEGHLESINLNMEKMVAAAAAKVIREEISALVAGMQESE